MCVQPRVSNFTLFTLPRLKLQPWVEITPVVEIYPCNRFRPGVKLDPGLKIIHVIGSALRRNHVSMRSSHCLPIQPMAKIPHVIAKIFSPVG